jgi:hypothetical protein
MELRHFAEKRIELDRSRVYPATDRGGRSPFAKPRGLWISDESEYGWRKWCEEEGFRVGALSHEHEVTLTIGTQPLLLLSTAEQVREFSARYGYQEDYGTNGDIEHTGIDWARVREDFAGVFITPYQWELRFELDWYYGWDVASGCVWNLSVIESVEPVRQLAIEP